MWEELRVQVLTERGVGATLAAAGAKRVELPDWQRVRAGLVADLSGASDVPSERSALLADLGLR